MSALVRADRAGGFTLVELLVSLVILALVALLMVSGLRFVVGAVASTDSRREALEELTLGLSVLRGELARAEPLVLKVGNSEQVLFEGSPDRLRFVNVTPPYLGGPPYLVYEYAVSLDDGAYRIDLRRAPLDPDEPDLAAVEAAEPRTVLRLGQKLEFTYYGRLRERDEPTWRGEWPPGTRLPTAIRLAQGEEPGWPDLVVRTRITAPWYCAGADGASAAGCPGAESGAGDRPLAPGDGTETPFGETAAKIGADPPRAGRP